MLTPFAPYPSCIGYGQLSVCANSGNQALFSSLSLRPGNEATFDPKTLDQTTCGQHKTHAENTHWDRDRLAWVKPGTLIKGALYKKRLLPDWLCSVWLWGWGLGSVGGRGWVAWGEIHDRTIKAHDKHQYSHNCRL